MPLKTQAYIMHEFTHIQAFLRTYNFLYAYEMKENCKQTISINGLAVNRVSDEEWGS